MFLQMIHTEQETELFVSDTIILRQNQPEKLKIWKESFPEYFQKGAGLEGHFFANSSVKLSPEYNSEMERLCSVLNLACKAIVENYFNDERIRNYYQLDKELEALLKKCIHKVYNQGFYRPDFYMIPVISPRFVRLGHVIL